jgi:rhodanese-related sulfurtransferase
MDLKSYQLLEFIHNRLSGIEKNIAKMDEKLDFSIALQRNHLIRVKNGEDLDDNMILMGRPYNDLTPAKAFDIFNNNQVDYILLDVTHKSFMPTHRPTGNIHIPLEELGSRYPEINSKLTPILILSEQGLRSIQACEILIKKGYFNVNNISGGYQFWPEYVHEEVKLKSVAN